MEKVAVLIPVFNEEKNIINTLKSVLNSNYDNFEVIIVNDGSTDNTKKLVEDFIKDKNIKFINFKRTEEKELQYIKPLNLVLQILL